MTTRASGTVPRRRALLALASLACRRRPTEERVRAALLALEEAVEAEDLDGCREAISAHFSSGGAPDRAAALALLRAHFFAEPPLHIFARELSLEVAPPDAHGAWVVAMGAVPVNARSVPAGVSVYRFELSLAEESGVWRVTRAAWEPATVDELF